MLKKIAIAAALALAFAPLRAETIRMRDGSYQSGEVLSSDDSIVRIRFSGGLELDLKWDQLAPGEAERIKTRSEVEKAARFKVDGAVIYTKNDTLEGIVLEETADKIKLKTAKGNKDIMKSMILRREDTKINALSVYSPEDLYASKLANYKTDTAAGCYSLGELCLALGLNSKAKEHYVKALELDPTWKSRIDPRLSQAESGIKEMEAAAMLKEAEALLTAKKLEDALVKLKEVVEKYPGTSAAAKAADLAAKGDQDVSTMQDAQKKQVDLKRAKEYYAEMTASVRKAATSKLSFQEIKEFVEKSMATEIITKLATKDAIEVKTWEAEWKSRELEEWKSSTYGPGSWLLEPETLAIEASSSIEDREKKAKQAALIEALKKAAGDLRKSPDDWWGKQPQNEKIAWLMAYAAEKTMILKQPVDHPNCSKCAGKGIIGASALCTRCLGMGKDRVVNYK